MLERFVFMIGGILPVGNFMMLLDVMPVNAITWNFFKKGRQIFRTTYFHI